MPPFTPAMAKRHKKNMSATQVRQWCAVAQSAYDKCMKEGGKGPTCEASAIRQANGVTGTPKLATKQAEPVLQLIAARLNTQAVRYEMLDGRQFLVAPVVPIIAGVLNSYYVPEDEIAVFADAWNDIPLCLGHPQNDYGDYISGRSPTQLEQSPGRFFGARMDGPRLLGEVWLDVAKCTQMGGMALATLERIQAGEHLECSTAFFSETVAQSGTFNGRSYQGIHRHLRPDHLALLPEDIGACSLADGCGVRAHCAGACDCAAPGDAMHETSTDQGRLRSALRTVLAFAGLTPTDPAEEPAPLTTNLTHADIAEALCCALMEQSGNEMPMYYGGTMLVDVLDDYVIYKDQGELYRQAYTIDDQGIVQLTGDPEDVQRNTAYLPTGGGMADNAGGMTASQAQGGTMPTKAEMVQALIVHTQTSWTEQDKETLEAMADATLTALLAEAEKRMPQAVTPPQDAPLTITALKALLDERDQALETRLTALTQQQSEQAERQHYTAALTANGWTPEECASMPLTTLKKVAQTVAPVSYAGMGYPTFATEESNDLPDDDPKGY